MKKTVRAFLLMLGLVASTAVSDAQQMSDPRIADLVKAGKVRFGMFPPQYTKDAATGELKGPYVEVMRALATHMELSVVLTELPTPGSLVECLNTGPCDIGPWVSTPPGLTRSVGSPLHSCRWSTPIWCRRVLRSAALPTCIGRDSHRRGSQSCLNVGPQPHCEASGNSQRRNSGRRIRLAAERTCGCMGVRPAHACWLFRPTGRLTGT